MHPLALLPFLGLAWLLGGPATAHGKERIAPFDAAHFCAPRENLRQGGFTCQDNDRLSAAAEECLQKFLDYIQQNQAELQAKMELAMATRIKTGSASNQSGDYSNSGLDYQDARNTFSHLLSMGDHSREELKVYRRSLRLAFHWPRGVPFPDPDEPTWEAYFSSDACYGDHNARIRAALGKIDEYLAELANAKASNGKLQLVSGERLGQAAALNGQSAAAGKAVGSGHSENRASDVTGLRKDRGNQDSRVNGNVHAGAATIATATSGRPRGSSAVTSRGDAFAPYSMAGNLEESARRPASAPTAATGENSVGAVLWSEDRGVHTLAVAVAVPAGGVSVSVGVGVNTDEGGMDAGSTPTREALASSHGSLSAASDEKDLFRMVRNYYRKTDLFRQARP